MGDGKNDDLRVDFDRKVKIQFVGCKISSDAGLLAYRELDKKLSLTESCEANLSDSRRGKNKQHQFLSLFRQSIFSRLAGYEDVNDAERLAYDPVMRQVVGGRATQNKRQAASSSEMGRFETKILSSKKNLNALMNLSGQWIDQLHKSQPPEELILDLDSSVSETHGHQQGSAFNGHFGCHCYHPLFLFNQFGDLEMSMLRRGNQHSSKFWRHVLAPVVSRYKNLTVKKLFRADAAFAIPKLFEHLETHDYGYTIRLKANAVLEEQISHLLTRPVGRPSHKPKFLYASFYYRAKSWRQARRVVAKVEWHAAELFPRVGFIVTNMTKHSKNIVKFYNGRGTAEQWIKEGKNALKWTKLSCLKFKDNQTRLQLFSLAYNLANFLRRIALPKEVKHWSLTTLREKLIKIGCKIVRHAKYITFQLAEVAIPRKIFSQILNRIAALPSARSFNTS